LALLPEPFRIAALTGLHPREVVLWVRIWHCLFLFSVDLSA
jgi:hypothetical protein